MDSSKHWVGTLAMAPAPSEAGITSSDQTVRMHPRVSLGGDTIRVRLSNAYGMESREMLGVTAKLR